MSIREKLAADMKAAMRAREKTRLSTIRLLLAELKNSAIDKKRELDESEELTILARAAKQRRESIEAYRKGARDDLADQEAAELQIIEGYLPEQLSADEVREIIRAAIEQTGASTKKDFGRVMGAVMPKLKGRFPGKEVRPLVEELLKKSQNAEGGRQK